jgi:fatty acid desaturase
MTDLRQLRVDLLARYPARPLVYIGDLAASAIIGWGSLWASLHQRVGGWEHIVTTVVAVVALLRTGFFIHEVGHQRKALPWLGSVWNIVAGFPLLMPAFMVDSHTDHHRLSTYGTDLDPEYEQFGDLPRWRVAMGLLVMPLVGPALALRALLLSPLSLLLKPFWAQPRGLLLRHASSLVTNERYVNNKLIDTPAVIAQELACSACAWSALLLLITQTWPWAWFLQFFMVFAIAMTINQVRTQTAHGYHSNNEPMSLEQQVADSSTTLSLWLAAAVHPLGTQHHALHHLAPTLPYHSMAAAHRDLCRLVNDGPYHARMAPDFITALRRFWRPAH